MVPPLRILHTSDLHGALTPAKAETVARVRSEVDVWLDSGDAVGRPRGLLSEDPTLRRLREAGLDAMTPGNHELLLLGSEDFDRMPVRFLCANLTREQDTVFPAIASDDDFGFESASSGRKRLAVIGITTPFLKYSKRPLRRLAAEGAQFQERLRVHDPFQSAARWVEEAKRNFATVILLSHLGSLGDSKLARAAPEADIILGGHTHELLPPLRRDGVWTAQPGVGASHYGLYEWDGETLSGELVPL